MGAGLWLVASLLTKRGLWLSPLILVPLMIAVIRQCDVRRIRRNLALDSLRVEAEHQGVPLEINPVLKYYE